MFDLSWSELLIIGVIALLVIGPKELPGVLRSLGHWMGKVRRMASEFQSQFQEAMREAEVADVKQQFDDMTGSLGDYAKFDPMDTVQKEVDGMIGDPFGDSAPAKPAAASPEAASPEAASPSTPAPVSSDFTIPRPDGATDVATAPEAPQPEAPQPKSASGGGG
jgi:sec-independent protein translocase protein TatB